MNRKQSGFTLVELIVVIVLIGILASVAIPRFINTTSSARKAALSGLQGGIQSAVTLAQAEYRAEGNSSSSAVTTINMDGTTVTVVAGSGTPVASTSNGIAIALSNVSGFTISTTTSTTAVQFDFSTAVANCYLTYTQGATPTVTLTTTGC